MVKIEPEKATYAKADAIPISDLTRDLYPAELSDNSGKSKGF
jgi:hypothetical protein